MGKKRKTYKEKLIADLRRKVYTLEGVNTSSFEHEKKHTLQKQPYVPAAIVLQNQNPYILKDAVKTGILTTSIIAIQLILFLILKNNILSLPGVSY